MDVIYLDFAKAQSATSKAASEAGEVWSIGKGIVVDREVAVE